MPSVYTGNPTNITSPLAATVSGATGNAVSPIVITTSSAHGYASGDHVMIKGASGNTAANGEWVIIVTDATHFSLTGSTGNGTWTSGGTCTNLSFTPQFNIPSDGDPQNVSSVNVGAQMLADRSQWLKDRVGGYFLVDYLNSAVSGGTAFTTGSPGPANYSFPSLTRTPLAGDIYEVTISNWVSLSKGTNSGTLSVAFAVKVSTNGVSFASPSNGTGAAFCGTATVAPSSTVITQMPVSITATQTLASSIGVPITGELSVLATLSTGDSASDGSVYSVVQRLWRAT